MKATQTPIIAAPSTIYDAWDLAVLRYGEETVEAGNDAMLGVEFYREALARIDAGELADVHAPAFRDGLAVALNRAAKLAAEGNRYLYEVAERDAELKDTIIRNGIFRTFRRRQNDISIMCRSDAANVAFTLS